MQIWCHEGAASVINRLLFFDQATKAGAYNNRPVFVAFLFEHLLEESLLRDSFCRIRQPQRGLSLLVICMCLLIGGVFTSTPVIAGGRIIKQDSDNDGRIDRIAHLAPSGDLIQLEADTNGDQKMDTFQYYERGTVVRLESDADGDGRIDQVTKYDAQGRPVESRHDFDEDGEMDTVRLYQNGELYRQEHFKNGKTRPDIVTGFADGRPVSEKRDTNGDGAFDVLVHMPPGEPISREEDTDHDGRMDRFTRFDDEDRPLVVQEFAANSNRPMRISRFKDGKLFSVEQFDKGRVVLTRFQDDNPITQTIDEDQDGRPEQIINFDKNGLVKSATIDTNRDGRIDTWQHYAKGVLYRVEQDRDHDGKVDARLRYTGGKLFRSLLDEDGDGDFETVVSYDSTEWNKVVEVSNKKGRLINRLSFLEGLLRKKELFDPDTGCLVSVEEYNQAGRIVLSREAENGSCTLSLTWRYDEHEIPVLAEKDSDGDGQTDIWYHYENGRIKKVEEDRNRDGKPDLWETYDTAQVVVHRSEDLDFDGTVDIEKRF